MLNAGALGAVATGSTVNVEQVKHVGLLALLTQILCEPLDKPLKLVAVP